MTSSQSSQPEPSQQMDGEGLAFLPRTLKDNKTSQESIGEKRMKWFDSLFAAVIGISSLGAGFTFSLIFSDPAVPLNQIGRDEDEFKEHIRFLLALSWVFFIAAIGLASGSSLLFNAENMREWFLQGWEKDYAWPNVVATLSSFGAQSLPTCAFLVASWAISFYCPRTGWAAFGLCGCFGLVLLSIVLVKAWYV